MLSLELIRLGLGLLLALLTYSVKVEPLTLDLRHLAELANSTRTNSTNVQQASEIMCTGEYFGYNPSISDCYSALRRMAPDHEQVLWGLRHTGLGDSVFPLPYRIMGGELFRSERGRTLTARPQKIGDCASSRP